MAHHNTILNQMLKMFSRHEFQNAVSQTGTEYHARGFSSWNHFVSMLFGQLAGIDSLRGIEAGLATQSKCLYHLGVKPVQRFPTPMNIATMNCLKRFLNGCCPNVNPSHPNINFVSKTP